MMKMLMILSLVTMYKENDNDAENLLDNQEIGDIAVNHNVPNDNVGNIQNANNRPEDERLLEDGPENILPRRDLIQI